MDGPAALVRIKTLAAGNRVTFTVHALDRMQERGAKRADVISALLTATSARLQERGTWAIDGGVDRDGDELSVRADIEDDVLVITVY